MVLIYRTVKDISTEQILEGLVNNNSFIIQYVYKKFFAIVRSYILNHGGDEEDARDIFQDGIMVIYEQRKNRNLEIKSGFGTYIYSVCRYKYLNMNRNTGKLVYTEVESINNEMEKKGLGNQLRETEELSFKESRSRIYQKNFEKLSKECRKLLKMMAEGLSVKEIQRGFNYKSEGFAYKKRSICKSRLSELIKQDKYFNNNENF